MSPPTLVSPVPSARIATPDDVTPEDRVGALPAIASSAKMNEASGEGMRPSRSSLELLTRVTSSLREGLQLSTHLTVVVLGASGDLAKKKTYPALFELFRHDFLPENLDVIGYARSKLSDEDLRTKLRGFLKADDAVIDKFMAKCTYVAGAYDGDADSAGYAALQAKITELEKAHPGNSGRLFYLALPPKVRLPRMHSRPLRALSMPLCSCMPGASYASAVLASSEVTVVPF